MKMFENGQLVFQNDEKRTQYTKNLLVPIRSLQDAGQKTTPRELPEQVTVDVETSDERSVSDPEYHKRCCCCNIRPTVLWLWVVVFTCIFGFVFLGMSYDELDGSFGGIFANQTRPNVAADNTPATEVTATALGVCLFYMGLGSFFACFCSACMLVYSNLQRWTTKKRYRTMGQKAGMLMPQCRRREKDVEAVL